MNPFGGGNPFQGMPIFGDLANMFQQQASMGFSAARQLALSIAAGGAAEPNVDPVDRIKIEQLARVAELQVANATGLDPAPGGQGITIVAVNRSAWAQRTLDDYRPLFEALAASLKEDPAVTAEPDPGDPMGFMAPLLKMIGPMMLELTAGSMVGHLSQRCLGQYDLPIPRPAGSNELLIVVPNLDEFGREWSLPEDDLRLWVCLHEVTHHAVLALPHVRARLDRLLHDYLDGFEPDPDRLEQELTGFENFDMSDPNAFQKMMSNPEVVLGAVQSDAQRALLPQLEALVCAVVGYVDHVMDKVGTNLIGGYAMITEAVRRRRVEAAAADRFVEQLFGLELTQTAYDRGSSFVEGIVEREGEEGLARLWQDERNLPTPAEVDAPGLWLARIDLPADEA